VKMPLSRFGAVDDQNEGDLARGHRITAPADESGAAALMTEKVNVAKLQRLGGVAVPAAAKYGRATAMERAVEARAGGLVPGDLHVGHGDGPAQRAEMLLGALLQFELVACPGGGHPDQQVAHEG
jgi:hypothetical protein